MIIKDEGMSCTPGPGNAARPGGGPLPQLDEGALKGGGPQKDKHLLPSTFTGQFLQSRRLGFGVFIDIWFIIGPWHGLIISKG